MSFRTDWGNRDGNRDGTRVTAQMCNTKLDTQDACYALSGKLRRRTFARK